MNADPDNSTHAIVSACFLVTWLILAITGFFLFYGRGDVAFKRRWFPWYVVLGGVLFVGFSITMKALSIGMFGVMGNLALLVPATCLLCWLNMKFVKFCDHCGAMAYSQNWFAPLISCPKCGARLGPKPDRPDDGE